MHFCVARIKLLLSLPIRGAWIEILRNASPGRTGQWSLPIRGAWIEMVFLSLAAAGLLTRRSPYGERGLKLYASDGVVKVVEVAPHTGSVD